MKNLRKTDVYFYVLQGLMSEFDMLCRVLLIPPRCMLQKLIKDVDADVYPHLYKHISYLLSTENDWFKVLRMRNFWTQVGDDCILQSFALTFKYLNGAVYHLFEF